MQKNKGFTLIELLIVIAIIGLLATLALISLTTAQQRARDTKRVADMKSMQTALELYYNEQSAYPRVDVVADSNGTSTWDKMATTMAPYISQLPVAPNHDADTPETYQYLTTNGAVDTDGDTNPDEEFYMQVTLEKDDHPALDQDNDGGTGGNVGGAANWALLFSQPTANPTTPGTAYESGNSAVIDCGDDIQSYCLSGTAG